jgi:hypothetical protein
MITSVLLATILAWWWLGLVLIIRVVRRTRLTTLISALVAAVALIGSSITLVAWAALIPGVSLVAGGTLIPAVIGIIVTAAHYTVAIWVTRLIPSATWVISSGIVSSSTTVARVPGILKLPWIFTAATTPIVTASIGVITRIHAAGIDEA